MLREMGGGDKSGCSSAVIRCDKRDILYPVCSLLQPPAPGGS